MARLFADENFPRPTVEALRRLGHDVQTCADVGLDGRGVPDDAILAFATSDDRAVLTLDRRDFFALHVRSPGHGGIVACTYDRDFAGLANRISAALMGEGDVKGRLLRVNRPNP